MIGREYHYFYFLNVALPVYKLIDCCKLEGEFDSSTRSSANIKWHNCILLTGVKPGAFDCMNLSTLHH